MHIHFSTSFGFGNVYPRLVRANGSTSLGEMQLGLKGLLEYMELHLGIFKNDVWTAMRVSQYKKAVKTALKKDQSLYIKASFAKDPWGTAKQLLLWRDELQLALWDFDGVSSELQRLYCLACVEQELGYLSEGVNDRLRGVYNTLSMGKSLPIQKLSVYESKDTMEPFFTNLFKILSSQGVEVSYLDSSCSYSASDLGSFKKKMARQSKTEKIPAVDDGSIIILKAENEKLIADTLSVRLGASPELKPLFIIPNRGEILEEALVNKGLSAIGCQATNKYGSLEQLVSLVTVFLWEPYDPAQLLQFLNHPDAPISNSLRKKLAQAYAEKSDANNEKWNSIIREHVEKYPDNKPTIDTQIKKWFGRKTYTMSSGAPLDSVISIYTDLKEWAVTYALTLDEQNRKRSTLLALSKHCDLLMTLMRLEAEHTFIQESTLQYWIGELENNSLSTDYSAQLGAYDYVVNPGAIYDSSDLIIWWNFLDTGNPVSNSAYWTSDEIQALSEAQIYTDENRIKHWYRQLTNGINHCGKQLILCLPQKCEGQVTDANPLYYDLEATFDELHNLMTRVELSGTDIEILGQKLELETYPEKNLPTRSLSWKIRTDQRIEPRETESFSSLSKLFYYPYAYLLNYQLGIKPIEIPEISVNPRMKGNLTHNIAEKLFADEQLFTFSDSTLSSHITDTIASCIKEDGAILLQPRHTTTCQEFIDTVYEALYHLVGIIRANQWSVLWVEKEEEILDDINTNGKIDLVLERDNELCVIDLKWGGMARKRKELIEEQELQLIIYAKLLQEYKKRIHLHYYIITSKKMLGRNTDAFSETLAIESKTADELEQRKIIWNKMVNTYKLRLRDAEEGYIEVGDGLDYKDMKHVEELSEKNDDYLLMPIQSKITRIKLVDKYSNYKNIIGRI